MGDPRRIRKKYQTPEHPWIKSRIDEEKRLSKEFGTKNKKELYKMETVLKNFKSQAKKLIALTTDQAAVEREHLFRRVSELGLVSGDVTYDSILSLTSDDVLARRLQSIVFKKGLARSIDQARQFVTHEHIVVGDKLITSPSYLVTLHEESQVGFAVNSAMFKEDHPERADKTLVATPVKDESEEEVATPVEEVAEEQAEEVSESAQEATEEKTEETSEEKEEAAPAEEEKAEEVAETESSEEAEPKKEGGDE